jgi:hypothetical protein
MLALHEKTRYCNAQVSIPQRRFRPLGQGRFRPLVPVVHRSGAGEVSFLFGLLGFGKAIVGWLSRRSLTELAAIALAVLCVVQFVALKSEKRHSAKLQVQVSKLHGELKRISDEADKAKARGDQLAKELRSKTDEANRRIAGDAGTLRVSGPGKARCPAVPAAPGGSEPRSGKPDAAGPEVPPENLAAVSWPWLVHRAEQADLNRQEVLTWREWYDKMVKDWPKR